jgi:hypothetical protein
MRNQGRSLGRENYKCTLDKEMCPKLLPVTLDSLNQGLLHHLQNDVPPSSTLPKTNDIDLNIDINGILEKINVHVPLTEIIKIPSMRSKVEKFFRVQGKPVDPPVMLQANHFRPHYDEHPPFYISLQMNNKSLNNCMLDSGAGANVMALKVMRQLGLEVTRPYRNVCGIESKAIPTYGVIENLKVHLDRYPEIVF